MKNNIINKLILIIIGLLCLSPNIISQINKIKNINYSVYNKKVIVSYDIKGKNKQNDINLIFYDNDFRYIYPQKLKGDFGSNVSTGTGKSIIWDISNDLSEINSPIKPLIIINGKDNRRYGGASNALLSVLVPGLGDYFVSDPVQIKFKPVLRTITAWGFTALGIYALKNRSKTYITTIKTGASNPDETVTYEGPTKYWAFLMDGEVFLTLGIGTWIYDIIWVSIRGKKNQEYKKRIDGISFYDNTSNSFQYGVSFSLNKK